METSTITKAVPVLLPVNDWADLKREAQENGQSASEIVRNLVREHLRRKQRIAPKQTQPVA
jgi:hypothetical protein